MAWFRLIRWKNLLIIFFTQLLTWYCVIRPAEPAVLDFKNFLHLALSTILIAAAGYIINDYFDIKIDSINKPEKVVLGRSIPSRQAIIVHSVLNVLGLLLAGFVAYRAHHYEWISLQLLCTVLLWFYSTHLKRWFIAGNIAVGVLTALTVISLSIYEPAVKGLSEWVLYSYAYFAFMLTWIREIVKDMEDFKGDAEEGCMTMPIKWGLKKSILFIMGLGLLVVIPLSILSYTLFTYRYELLSLYLVIFLILPLAGWSAFLRRGTSSRHYHKASTGLKIIMVLGIVSLVAYYLQMFSK